METTIENKGFNEKSFTKFIDRQTAGIESNSILWASAGIVAFSIALRLLKQKRTASFVGQLAIPLLLIGINKKISKRIDVTRDEPTLSIGPRAGYDTPVILSPS